MGGLLKYDMDPADLDPNGIAENQTTPGAANLILNGVLSDAGTALQFDIGDAYSDGIGGVILSFDAVGDISGVNFTITGKDQDGVAVTEVVTGVTTTAVPTTKFYSQVTQIAADAAVGSTVFVGTVAAGGLVSKSVGLNHYSENAAVTAISGKTGTVQFDVQETFENLNDPNPSTATWFNVVSNQSTDQANACTAGATGCRLKFDSYSNGAELQFHVSYNPYR